MGKDLRKKKIEIKAEIIASIPNHEKGAEVVYKLGTSEGITLPANWRMLLPTNGDSIQKFLLKMRINTTPFTYIEHYLLLITAEDFPIEKVFKEGILG